VVLAAVSQWKDQPVNIHNDLSPSAFLRQTSSNGLKRLRLFYPDQSMPQFDDAIEARFQSTGSHKLLALKKIALQRKRATRACLELVLQAARYLALAASTESNSTLPIDFSVDDKATETILAMLLRELNVDRTEME